MPEIKVGAFYKLTRPTFMLKGVFVNQGSLVEVLTVQDDKVIVRYRDKEGEPHTVEDVRADELAEVGP